MITRSQSHIAVNTRLGLACSILLTHTMSQHPATATEPVARTVTDAIAAAEKAYQEVDFAGVHAVACPGLTIGHADVDQTVRLHVLCGISAAALEMDADAKQHFSTALAIRPDLRLDRELSPKIRGPYLEAQGHSSISAEKLTIRVLNSGANNRELSMKVIDPAHLASSVEVYTRLPGQSRFQLLVLEVKPVVTVSPSMVHHEEGFEFYARLVDSHTNAVVELGNQAEPLEFHPRVLAAASSKSSAPADNGEGSKRSYWLPLTLTLGGAASTAVGVYFNLKRENAAHQWNSSECEQAGNSRIQQCSSVNADRVHAERAAIGFYAGGAALMLGGITSWVLRSSPERPGSHTRAANSSLSCAAAPFAASIECRGTF